MINIGNLTIKEIESRAGVEFPPELKGYMEPRHQAEASKIKAGKWHCFDIPFTLVCGDMETATQIHNHLKGLAANFTRPLQISLQS